MKKIIFSILIICFLSAVAYAELVPFKTLIEQGNKYDKKLVEVYGEAFGDKMFRGDKVWINILGQDGTAMGILCSKYQANKIRILGDYNHRGDRVIVKGYFQRFFQEQGGETAINAYDIEVKYPGYKLKHKVPVQKIWISIILLLIASVLIFVYKKFR
ncbi:DNA-binding protein [Candidatus Margulisiibacteriota bacterium]